MTDEIRVTISGTTYQLADGLERLDITGDQLTVRPTLTGGVQLLSWLPLEDALDMGLLIPVTP